MMIKAFELADAATKEVLWHWIEKKDFDREEKVAAVTRIYDRLEVKKYAFALIDKYLNQSLRILDSLDVAEDRKADIREIIDDMSNRKK